MRKIRKSEYRMLDRITDKYNGLTFRSAITCRKLRGLIGVYSGNADFQRIRNEI